MPDYIPLRSSNRLRPWSLAAVVVLALAGPLHAGTFSSSTTAPAVQASDIANFAAQTGTDKWFFQTSNEANPADAAKGQTFTTGSAAILLKALTYKISAGNMKAAPTTYTVRVGTLSGTAFTQVASETFSQTANTSAGAYMTWRFAAPVLLSANTSYAIDVGMVSGVVWTKVISAGLNTNTHTVSAPSAATYYWRVDSYLNGVATGTPVTGTRFSFIVFDSDQDGLPDAYELAHTTPPSATALNPGDDLDSDGLTNLQEYQRGTLPRDADTDNDGPELTGVGSRPPTDPLKADTDGDGISDGAENNTGVWVSAASTGTNPTKTDTDADGLSDGVDNGIEWLLGGDNSTNGCTALPGVVNAAGSLRVSWMKSPTFSAIYGTDFVVETTDTLGGTWTPEPLGTNVVITGNEVRYTFPLTGAKKFARVKVIAPPL